MCPLHDTLLKINAITYAKEKTASSLNAYFQIHDLASSTQDQFLEAKDSYVQNWVMPEIVLQTSLHLRCVFYDKTCLSSEPTVLTAS